MYALGLADKQDDLHIDILKGLGMPERRPEDLDKAHLTDDLKALKELLKEVKELLKSVK